MRCKLFSLILSFCLFAATAQAERRNIIIEDKSTTGRTLKITAGQADGLNLREAVLVRNEVSKLVAGRVIALQPNTSVIYLVETYNGQHVLPKGASYNILYGVPLGDIPDLPDNIADTLPENPQNESFFTADGKELNSPDLDDSEYEQETRLRPNFPDKKLYATHNLSLGAAMYRNADLTQTNNRSSSGKTAYQGYAFRYQYNFKSSLWLERKMPLWIGTELGWGVYSFSQGYPDGHLAKIQVMPISANIKFIFELSKLLRFYPYIGIQNNLVAAISKPFINSNFGDLGGVQPMAGLGLNMIMSESIDARVDAGIDGILLAAVVKF
jgi:hypothetical protein